MPNNRLNRRAFLKGSLTLAGALTAPMVIPARALGRDGWTAPSERITIAHIGVGSQGGGNHVRTVAGLDGAQIIAVCDPFQSRRRNWADYVDQTYAGQAGRATGGGCADYGDFRELLARKDLDAVVIATPDHWHVPIALEAIRQGKDVYIEKPLGMSIEENRAIREAVRRSGAVFQYGTQQRSSDHVRFGCELALNGYIGEITAIEIKAPQGAAGGSVEPIAPPADLDYAMWLGPAPRSPYTKDRCQSAGSYHCYDNSIGFLGGWGAHPLDVLDWVWGERHGVPVEIEGTGVIPATGLFNAIPTWDVTMRYANGVPLHFVSTPQEDLTRLIGTQGVLEISRARLLATPRSLLEVMLGPEAVHLPRSQNQQQNFIDCVRTRQRAISDVESAFRSDAISHLSDIAIRCGRKIQWDNAQETIVHDAAAARRMSRPIHPPWHL